MAHASNHSPKSPLRLGIAALSILLAILLATPAMAAPPESQQDPTTQVSRTKRSKRSTSRSKRTRVRKKRKKAKPRSGAYFNGGLGVISVQESPNGAALTDGTLGNIGIGYRFSPEMAFEANLLAQFYDSQNGQDTASSNTLTGGNLNLKYFFAISPPRVEAYGQAGLGYMNLETLPGQNDISGLTLDIGGGIEYRTNKQFAFGGRIGYSTLLNSNVQSTNNDNTNNNNNNGFSTLSAMLTINVQL